MNRPTTLWTWVGRTFAFSRRVVSAFLRNRGILLAGGVGYNALLSLVPFLTLAVAGLSLFFEERRILAVLEQELKVLVPAYSDTIVESAQAFLRNQAGTHLLSVALLVFFSSMAFRMLEEAVAAIFHAAAPDLRRSFWVSALLPYLFLVLLMAALFAVTLATSGLDALGEGGQGVLLRVTGFGGLVLLFAGIYRVLPVVRISLSRAFVGGLCAAVLWRLVGLFTVYYFTNISMVNRVYGSLAAVVVLLLTLEIAFVILLLGAQVIAELEASAAARVPWYEPPRREPPA